jgi:hypothetical protein
MKALWELSEEMERAGNERDKDMLEVAGNIVEDTFCTGNGKELCLSSMNDVFENKENVSAKAGKIDGDCGCNHCELGEVCKEDPAECVYFQDWDKVNTERDIPILNCKGCVFFSTCEDPTHPADCLMFVEK